MSSFAQTRNAGKIEKQISSTMTVGRFSAWGGKLADLLRPAFAQSVWEGCQGEALAIRAGSEGRADICLSRRPIDWSRSTSDMAASAGSKFPRGSPAQAGWACDAEEVTAHLKHQIFA
jgi:hypothetical protein